MHVAGQSCKGNAALKNNILVDVTEDYRKKISASDKTKLVDIQTTVEIQETRRIWEHGKDLQISKRCEIITS
jgi:hypothetical protein